MRLLLLSALTVSLVAGTASAQSPAGIPAGMYYLRDNAGKAWYAADPTWVTAQVAKVNATLPAPVATVATYTTTEASFLGWLNNYRARAGLRSVGWDAGLVAGCQANNVQQASHRTCGHFGMGGARRQNAAMSYQGVGHVQSMWAASAGHNAALLDPSITGVAISANGPWWTMGAR